MDRLPQPSDDEIGWLMRLPQGRAVTWPEVLDLGLTRRQMMRLLELRMIRRPFKGVYVVASLEDCTELRLEVLKLVVPRHCVVTDQTAGWLWAGDRILAPNAHLVTPAVSVFCRPGHRLRSEFTVSGERTFLPDDLVEVGGLVVTTPLRTACDLGRLLPRDQAFAALDTLAATGAFSVDRLLSDMTRFKGYRGVIQLRAFAPLVDPRSESQGESALRLRWYDAGLPRPECQVEQETPWGKSYWLDIGRVEELFGAEYDGEKFHGEDKAAHDASRRVWLRDEAGWTIIVFRKRDVYGRQQNAAYRLAAEWRLAELKRRRPA
jgi:hypothetical protein